MEYYKNLDLKDIVYFCEFDLVWKTEIWKDIPDYEKIYQVSDLGRVKSLKYNKEKILKQISDGRGYCHVIFSKDNKPKTFKVYKVVAITFLNHKPCGFELVINHKNFIRTDNRLLNLEIVTARENTNKKHLLCSSKYTGVSWINRDKVWRSQITIKGKVNNLGSFNNEYDAHLAYQKALKEII